MQEASTLENKQRSHTVLSTSKTKQQDNSATNLYDEWFELVGGVVVWKKAGRGVPKGAPASISIGKNGYSYFWLRYKRHLVHRVIFYLHHKYLPEVIDHIDCNPQNNCVSNLREASAKKNMMNTTPRKGCASRFKGVARKRNKWRAYVTKDKVTHQLGTFESEEEAALAYNKKAVELFGEFANLNEV